MKLYGSLASPYVARVALTAKLKGLDITPERPAGGLKSPEFLAINPLGKMPAFEHEGRHLFESTVICEYLDEAFPAQALMPVDAWSRARVRLLVRLLDLYLGAEMGILIRNMDPATRDVAAVDSAKAKVVDYLRIMDGLLVPGAFAAGVAPTLADCTLLPSFLLMRRFTFPPFGIEDPLATQPNLKAWFEHLQADARFAAFIAEYEVALEGLIAWIAAGRPGA
jgi:glutathione S-transferase